MTTLPLRLMTRDSDLKARWSRWLTAEGWSVVELPLAAGLPRQQRDLTGPLLLDASLLKDTDMPAVRQLSAARSPVILFGEGANASNESVARWLTEAADDFIPASIQERLLVAKLQAFARRISPDKEPAILFSRRREIKADRRRAAAWTKAANGRWEPTSPLTKTEHGILCLFLSLPETVLERDFMLDRLWGDKASEIYSANLTQHVMSLRKKMGAKGDAIRTVYGRGYMLLEER
jgi:DNA-binding response OmpR family regulator